MLKHNAMLPMVIQHPEIWDKLSKLHIVTYKAQTKDNIKWCLEILTDMVVTKQIAAEDVSGRQLKGWEGDKGLVTLLVCKRQLRDELLQYAQTKFSGWQPDIFVKLFAVCADLPTLRDQKHIDNLSWQRGWQPSALRFLEVMELVLTSDTHDKQLRVQMNNNRSSSDFIANMAGLKEALHHVSELYDAESRFRLCFFFHL